MRSALVRIERKTEPARTLRTQSTESVFSFVSLASLVVQNVRGRKPTLSVVSNSDLYGSSGWIQGIQHRYTREMGEDLPEIVNWRWSAQRFGADQKEN